MAQTKVTVPFVMSSKGKKKIVSLTAYDYPSAFLADGAGVDIVLVGDSLSNVILGYKSTIPVTMEEMLHHTKAVRRGVERALLVADMPFLSFHISLEETIRNAGRFFKEGGAEAIKVEGGKKRIEIIKALVDREMPVMGHLGLLPQSIHKLGGYKVLKEDEINEEAFLEEALSLEEAGIFALVLECVPQKISKKITDALKIPTIGIGSGPFCDGQILVFHDLLGFFPKAKKYKFVREYAKVGKIILKALKKYKKDVEEGSFPSQEEAF
ncbi:MAG: 3-methyl-2-oxobutanoate hydroxymethyltransferase [Thermoanaerobaculia bacterium]